MRSTRAREEDRGIKPPLSLSTAEALAPSRDHTERATNGISQLLERPIRMQMQEREEMSSLPDIFSFHSNPFLEKKTGIPTINGLAVYITNGEKRRHFRFSRPREATKESRKAISKAHILCLVAFEKETSMQTLPWMIVFLKQTTKETIDWLFLLINEASNRILG
jgi:hypothetical protein